MTREEKISQAAYSQYCNSESICFNLMCDSFKQGAKWTDKNPQSPWISVKDRLPTKGGHYLCMDDNHNIAVLAFVGDKWINTKKFIDVPLEVVIYWMPIPEPPKE